MFIDTRVKPGTSSVRRSGNQVELHHSRTAPLLRTEPREGLPPSINMSPLRGETRSDDLQHRWINLEEHATGFSSMTSLPAQHFHEVNSLFKYSLQVVLLHQEKCCPAI